MYAVIKTGGRQAKVQEGDVLQVERMRAAGDVTFESILISGDDGTVITDRDALAKMPVKGKVLGEIRGKKVDVFHYRNKSGYRKSAGHRQTYTTVEITEIPGAPKKKAAAKKADKPKADKPKAEKKPAAKKPAAKKADEPKAEKKPAAKKSTAKETTKGEDE
ncbi:MAG: 50S ribosomal protein L21 [Acidimicrobiia bacterium]|nr:50S ribosomal protein L21 [Acidimicrobiia bacterium]